MRTIADLDRWLAAAPEGTTLSARAVRDLLSSMELAASAAATAPAAEPQLELTWKERLWIVPAETRIGCRELAEAIGRPVSWIYRHTSSKAASEGGYELLPFRKLDGELVFVVGEIRAWLRDHEEVVAAGRMESEKAERAGWRVTAGGQA